MPWPRAAPAAQIPVPASAPKARPANAPGLNGPLGPLPPKKPFSALPPLPPNVREPAAAVAAGAAVGFGALGKYTAWLLAPQILLALLLALLFERYIVSGLTAGAVKG